MSNQKNQEPEQEAGAPEWMVTFSDCMTLLLTFFVLLLSFSSFEKEKFDALAKSFGVAMKTVAFRPMPRNNSMVEKKTETPADKGSTTPTQVEQNKENTMRETDPKNFRQLRVFTAPAEDFFLSSGKLLSPNGKETLDLIAKFLNNIPSRVVISEIGSTTDNNPLLGLPRAYEIMNYLKKAGVPENLLNISSANTLHQNVNYNSAVRNVQITLLERDIYEP